MNSDGSNRRPIPGAPNLATTPLFWSPDGSRLLAFRCGTQCDVTILTLDGSGPVTVATFPNVRNGTWQPFAVPITAGLAVASGDMPAN